MQLLAPFIIIGILVMVNMTTKATSNTTTEVKSETTTKTSTPTKTLTPTPTLTTTSTTPPTQVPQPTTQSGNSSVGDFVYPNSNSSGSDTYESSDNPDTITDWYKERIKNMGMNVTSFVTTKTNGNVKNVLSGARSGYEVYVDITKNEGDTKTKIKVSTKSS